MSNSTKALVSVLVVFSIAYTLFATQVPRFSLEDLVDRSPYIVHGRVVRSWAEWDAKHRYIWTHYRIQVAETLRGNHSETVVVSEPGGRLDSVHQAFDGALSYERGEEIVVFLYRTPIGFLRATGGGQGKFTVGRDGRVKSDLAGAELIGRPPLLRARPGTDLRTLESLGVQDLKQRVRELAIARPAPAQD